MPLLVANPYTTEKDGWSGKSPHHRSVQNFTLSPTPTSNRIHLLKASQPFRILLHKPHPWTPLPSLEDHPPTLPQISKLQLMQCKHVKVESVSHNYYNSSTKPKFHKNTRLVGKIIEKNLSSKLLFKNTHNINNLSIKSIYRNRISPTPFRKRNNKPTSTWERKYNLTRKRKTIKITIQLGKGF